MSTEFRLIYKKTEIKCYNRRPKIKEILEEVHAMPDVIKYMDQKRQFKGKEIVRFDKFKNVLINTKIQFLKKDDGNGFYSEKLTSFIEGSVFFDGQLYWKVLNMWCTMYGNYFKYIHHEYLKCLRNNLIKITEPIHLSEPWKANVHEGAYNELCSQKPGFYIGDCITPPPYGIEFFDLMYIDPNTNEVYLYHVKEDFDGKSRIACEQLLVSLRTKRVSLNKSDEYLLTYYKEFMDKKFSDKKVKIPEKLKDFISFKKTLKDAIYVIAFRSSKNIISPKLSSEELADLFFMPKIPKSLHLEALLKEKVDANDFKLPIEDNHFFEQLQRGFQNHGRNFDTVDEIAEHIVEVLRNENLINSENEATDQLIYYAKEFIEDKLKHHMNGVAAKTVCRLLGQYRTQFKSFIAKIQLVRLQKETGGKFKICDILCGAEKQVTNEKKNVEGKRQLEAEPYLEEELDAIKKQKIN